MKTDAIAKAQAKAERRRVDQLEYAKLYGGSMTIEYCDTTHSYKWVEEDIYLDGVTSILKLLHKEALMPWASKEAAAAFRSYVEDWLATAKETGWRRSLGDLLPRFEREAKGSYKRKSEKATTIGTVAHAYANDLLSGQTSLPGTWDATEQSKKACFAVNKFLIDHRVEPSRVEQIIASKKYNYAGRCDFEGSVDGVFGLYDFKASKRFVNNEPYLEYKLQLAGYAVAREEETGEKYEHGGIIRLDKETGKPYLHMIDITHALKECWVRCRGLEQALQKVK